MTTYRIYSRPAVDAVSRQIEVGVLVGKSQKIQFAPIEREDAWRLALGLLEALRDGAA